MGSIQRDVRQDWRWAVVHPSVSGEAMVGVVEFSSPSTADGPSTGKVFC